MTRTVIIGGHGKVALLAAPLLAEAGHDVVSLIRNPDHQADLEANGASAVVVDLDDGRMGPAVQDLWMLLAGDPPTRQRQLAALLDGIDVVVHLAGESIFGRFDEEHRERVEVRPERAAIRHVGDVRQAGGVGHAGQQGGVALGGDAVDVVVGVGDDVAVVG